MNDDDTFRHVADALDDQVNGGGPVVQNGPSFRADGDGNLVSTQLPKVKGLPPEAPVRPLGTLGNRVFFLDAHSQLRELGAKDLNRTMILHLFGDETSWLYETWPTMKKVKDDLYIITGWDGTKAQEALMRSCSRRGLWRPEQNVRGRGSWADEKRGLVVHSGGRLHFSDGSTERPGVVGEYVYPAADRATAPLEDDEAPDVFNGSRELLKLLETWNFQRPFDARLLLGWIVSSYMAGALKVRPLAWVTGDKGTGKSSLVGQDGLIHAIFGKSILLTANTTAAGLYQKIEYDSLPVAIDEIEAKRGNQKTEAVIELARQAYSGGMVLRGGADHDGKQFKAMCPVLFGSILIPPLMPQDVSRLALLNLEPFPPEAREPKIDKAHMAKIGRAILRHVLRRWKDWPARLEAWHTFLQELGHSARAADQFGTLLAAADFVLSDVVPNKERMTAIAGDMKPTTLAETQAEGTNASRCVNYAMSRPIPAMRGGETLTAAELVVCAVRRYGGEMDNPIKPLDAVRYLERAGLSVMVQKIDGDRLRLYKPHRVSPIELTEWLDQPNDHEAEGVFVAFAPDGDGILELFRGSDWEGVPGAHNPYTQALGRAPGARKSDGTVRIGSRTCKPILVPIRECVDVPSEAEAVNGKGYNDNDE
ncbi:DNA primase [Roseivivax marinus]|uniref:DNA primase n=1 Tax=Roseivivax marinus TaxID=1379903 RepID=W4HEU1_9RHOB|nr:hypothetical protein [Roseivivax marinus]ETW10898.1 DNA primase [Roseivivax marinus]